jgi:hypothetical protein
LYRRNSGHGERAQLQQVIVNLCRNAAQAMGESGRIDLSADARHVMTARVFSSGELEPGSYARIVVSDAGPGFGEDVAKRLFEPFFTTRPAGTGLGLATVRRIVRDHDGAIEVDSAPGKGSRFEIWLPAANAGPSTVAREERAAPPPFGRGETVLVVYDDRGSLLGDEEILAALGYEPIGFDRRADAIAAVRRAPGRFDAVLISMPSVGDALDLARTLHAISPAQPILLARSVLDIAPTRSCGQGSRISCAGSSLALNSHWCFLAALLQRRHWAQRTTTRAELAKQTIAATPLQP